MKIITKSRILLLAAYLIFSQWYFVALSTQHALHNMPPQCPVCAMVNSFDDVLFSENALVLFAAEHEIIYVFVTNLLVSSYLHAYWSRAPPQN